MRALLHTMLGATALLCAMPAHAASFTFFESEPNNSRAAAQALTTPYSPTDPSVTIGFFGSLAGEGAGIVDWFSFTVPAITEGMVYRKISLNVFRQGSAGVPTFVLTESPGFSLDPTDTRTQTGGTFFVGIGNNAGMTATDYFARVEITAVPEPATWALMLAGFAMTGYALRRRRASIAFA